MELSVFYRVACFQVFHGYEWCTDLMPYEVMHSWAFSQVVRQHRASPYDEASEYLVFGGTSKERLDNMLQLRNEGKDACCVPLTTFRVGGFKEHLVQMREDGITMREKKAIQGLDSPRSLLEQLRMRIGGPQKRVEARKEEPQLKNYPAGIDPCRLDFARWLVVHGRLGESLLSESLLESGSLG